MQKKKLTMLFFWIFQFINDLVATKTWLLIIRKLYSFWRKIYNLHPKLYKLNLVDNMGGFLTISKKINWRMSI